MRGTGLLSNHASPIKNNIKGSKSEPGQAEIEKVLEKSQELTQAVSNQSISSTASTPTATTTTNSATDRAPAITRKGNRKYGSTQERVKRCGVVSSVVLGLVTWCGRFNNNFDTCSFIRYIATGIIAGNKTTVGTKGNEFKIKR